MLDIGAGTGAITGPLIEAGHRVVAIELHHVRARALEERLGHRVTVARADAADAPGIGRWAQTFAVRAGHVVPRHRFRPPPRNDSRVLIIERHGAGAGAVRRRS